MDPEATGALDWREQLLRAVAYRMAEMFGVEPEDARSQVRDVMQFGYNSTHLKPVADATLDMFRPILGTVLPMLPTIASAFMAEVERQNLRGDKAEARLQAL